MALRLHPQIAAAIARGATLLTPNQRAARAIRRAYDEAQLAAGATLWTPANALPLEAWLASLWQQRLLAGSAQRVLLNPTQEHLVWREIIAADPETPRLRSADSLAEMAARAWSLAELYNGRGRLRDFATSTDSRAFERWARAFDRRLTRAQWITAAQLPGELAAAPLPTSEVSLVDFDTHPPAIATLLASLPTETIQTSTASSAGHLVTAEDDHAELLAAARWIRACREAHPQARIAVVVPNLADRRADLDRAFAPILAPGQLPITAPASAPAYEFSLGRALAELPIATTALDLLTWPLHALSLERISAMLLSPWLGQATAAAAEFDAFTLRNTPLLRPELTLEATIALLESPRHSELGTLLLSLRNLHKTSQSTQLAMRPGQSEPHRQSFAQWSDVFRALLDAAGWTRHARTNSLNYQQHRRFDSALDQLATLDFDGHRPSAPEALAAFTRILGEIVFAPESTDAPIQVLGPLELGGVPFDALWFLGADDLAWPAPPAASPLLSWPFHRTFALPGADRTRDDANAQALTGRIAHSAPEAVFSYARRAEDGDRRPSPLLTALHLRPLALPDAAPLSEPSAFDLVSDDTTLAALPEGLTDGGSYLLKLQAACAFRAFAELRLHASQPESTEPGLDARERGSLVHTVMQHFWTGLPTQGDLLKLPPSELQGKLDDAIDFGLARQRAKPQTTWDHAYLSVQRQRLRDLLLPWLAIEAQRPAFTVRNSEEKKFIQLGPLALELRIDRIDTTLHGDVILDYKTGLASPKDWEGDRPDDPQLPLYAVLTQQSAQQPDQSEQSAKPLAGVAFALLRAGKGLDLKGYADAEDVFGKPDTMDAVSLAEQIEDWRITLTALATAFANGDTRVAPKDYPKTCAYCGQRLLCRLNPATLTAFDDEDPEQEGETVG